MPVGAPIDVCSCASAANDGAPMLPNVEKFTTSAALMIMGAPEEAAHGVAHALGLEDAELAAVLLDPVKAIRAEFEALRATGDAAALQALAEFEYICDGKAMAGKRPNSGAGINRHLHNKSTTYFKMYCIRINK